MSNLEDLYGKSDDVEDVNIRSNVMKVLKDSDKDLFDISINGKEYKVANQSFVIATKAYIEKLVHRNNMLEKEISKQTKVVSHINSKLSTLESKIKTIESRLGK